jgi:hypothetical protein
VGVGGGRSLPSANPYSVAAGGATDARCGGEGGEGGVGQITAHSNPHSSFSLSFFPLCIRRGFDEKILLSAVQYKCVFFFDLFSSSHLFAYLFPHKLDY